MVGRTVLQYQFVEKLGAGGMGEVYKALDTRLNRFVAIKVLSAGVSADPEYRLRFIHEAQSASALNHPNIVTIYDVVEDAGTQYMVLEYVPGKTLGELIPPDGMALPDVIRYASQIADALGAAHAAGIIHRDLKPANVMVTAHGNVKLLDFGLAKLMSWGPGDHSGNTATLISGPMTVAGAIMGSVNYMSPEQAEGARLDARSDIFSFGAVLYEMLTGRHAFQGASAISTLSAVLRDNIRPIPEMKPGVPLGLERIVVRCLNKDPDQRFLAMQEVGAELALIARQQESGFADSAPTIRTTPPPAAKPRFSLIPVWLLLLAAAAGGVYWFAAGHSPAASPATKETRAAVMPSDGTLTNDSIIDMVRAKVAPSVISSQIRASKTNFSLSPAEVIRLSNAGVPAGVIETMRNPVVPPAPPPAPAAESVTLQDGTLVRLSLAEDIPNDAKAGEPLRFKVAHELRIGADVVIADGAIATGTLVDGGKHKILGMGGKMTFRLHQVAAVNGRKVMLRATLRPNRDGIDKHPLNAGPHRPKDIASSAGTEYFGYIDGPQTVSVVK
jgi:serine/threonine-protein kinase